MKIIQIKIVQQKTKKAIYTFVNTLMNSMIDITGIIHGEGKTTFSLASIGTGRSILAGTVVQDNLLYAQ